MLSSWRYRITALVASVALLALACGPAAAPGAAPTLPPPSGAAGSSTNQLSAGMPPTPTIMPEIPATPLPTPQPPVNPTRTPESTMTREESQRIKEEFLRNNPGKILHYSGPETAGKLIRIAEKDIQLPPDAFIKHYITLVSCVEGRPCPETPYYVLGRGKSTIGVTLRSGTTFSEEIFPGEEGAFDFLKEALQR